MKKFIDEYAAKLEKMSRNEIMLMLQERGKRIVPAISAEFGCDETTAAGVFGTFVTGALMADGELSQAEYEIFVGNLEALAGKSLTRAECEALYEQSNEQFAAAAGQLSDFMGCLDDDAQQDLIAACLGTLALDGKVNDAEKRWILKLIRDAQN